MYFLSFQYVKELVPVYTEAVEYNGIEPMVFLISIRMLCL